MAIAGREIGGGAPVFVIAEIGINHGGDEKRCAEMIATAAEAGADAVKLQTVTPDASYHPDTVSYRLFKDCVLSADALARLVSSAESAGVILFSTPGDFAALDLLAAVGVPAIKISSGLLTTTPLIEAAARTGRPLILSTGMAYANEVATAVDTARAAGAQALALMQCTSLYPAPASSLNLRAMAAMGRRFRVPVGYSDHHEGGLACVAAAALGASMIEKHFTLDAGAAGADHKISLEPEAFATMVRDIRSVEAMLGSDRREPVAAEAPLRDARHRRLVAARDLRAGEVLSVADLHLMRLPDGAGVLPANQLARAVGTRLARDVAHLSGLTERDLKTAP